MPTNNQIYKEMYPPIHKVCAELAQHQDGLSVCEKCFVAVKRKRHDKNVVCFDCKQKRVRDYFKVYYKRFSTGKRQ